MCYSCAFDLFLFFALCQNVLRLPSHNKINQLSRVFKLKTLVHIFFCRVSKSFANGRNIQIEPLPHFKERAFHSFFGIFSFFILSSFGFLSKKSPLVFLIQCAMICKQKSIHYQATSVSYQKWSINSAEKQCWNLKGKQQATNLSHFTKFYWSLPSVNDILLGFL